jgi:hypothetical protein
MSICLGFTVCLGFGVSRRFWMDRVIFFYAYSYISAFCVGFGVWPRFRTQFQTYWTLLSFTYGTLLAFETSGHPTWGNCALSMFRSSRKVGHFPVGIGDFWKATDVPQLASNLSSVDTASRELNYMNVGSWARSKMICKAAKVLSELLQAEFRATTEEHGVGLANQPLDSPHSVGRLEFNGAPNPLWRAAGIDPNSRLYEYNIRNTCNVGVDHSGVVFFLCFYRCWFSSFLLIPLTYFLAIQISGWQFWS